MFTDSHKKLGLDLISDRLINECALKENKEAFSILEKFEDIDILKDELLISDEYLRFIVKYNQISINVHYELDKLVNKTVKSGILNELELFDFVYLESSLSEFSSIFAKMKENTEFIKLGNIAKNIIDISRLVMQIKKAIDYDGTVLDSASSTLRAIRMQLRTIDGRIKAKLSEIIANEKNKLAETFVANRNGKYCILVKAEHKNNISGFVVDASATNQTFYIEPSAVSELVNKKNQLIEDEKREIARILQELSSLIASYADSLYTDYDILVRLDYLQAKAITARKMDARIVNVTLDGSLDLINVRNPLLNVAKVIPNNINFQNHLGIIITGPNTGGKTVLLKTVGLVSLMVSRGLLVPCDENSTLKIYDKVYCDIGDDQDLQSNLSTFSSHMTKIVNIINDVTPNSLVLFDEIGSGTDPSEGSSLAIAILDFLVKNNISFITTTHYSKLKEYGFANPQVINASMQFDKDSLLPTYKLVLGMSGSSNAFYICKHLGLNSEILDEAVKLVKSDSTNNQDLIKSVENLNNQLFEKEQALLNKEKELQESINKYDKLNKELDSHKEAYKKKAENEAKKIIDQAKFDAKMMIKEIEDLKNSDIKLHDIANIKHHINNLDIEKDEPKSDPNYVFKTGENVYLPKYDQYGKILKVGKSYQVQMGNALITVKKEELLPTNKKMEIKEAKAVDVSQIKANKKVNIRLDLRGYRYEDAKDELERYLDDLELMNLKIGLIIHGYGTGAIRSLVQNRLKNDKNVLSYRYGNEVEGGQGVTVFELK